MLKILVIQKASIEGPHEGLGLRRSNYNFYQVFRQLDAAVDFKPWPTRVNGYDYVVVTSTSPLILEEILDTYKELGTLGAKLVVIHTNQEVLKEFNFEALQECDPVNFVINPGFFCEGVAKNVAEKLHPINEAVDTTLFRPTVPYDGRKSDALLYMGNIAYDKLDPDMVRYIGRPIHAYGSIEIGCDVGEYNGLVEHKGYTSEPHKVMNEYKYAVLLSHRDTWSLFVQEAMACGCIPIVFRNNSKAGLLSWAEEMVPDIYNQMYTFEGKYDAAHAARQAYRQDNAVQSSLMTAAMLDACSYKAVCKRYVETIIK